MESNLPLLSQYKKRLRHGLLHRKIRRLPIDENNKKSLYDLLLKILHSDASDYYLERRNQILRMILPFLLTAKRDRL